MSFNDIKNKVTKQFKLMTKTRLFKTNVNKDTMWELYLSSFPKGTNPLFREKTEHDCNCCKSFIRQFGNVVTIIDGNIISIWDIIISDKDGYRTVASALSAYVKSQSIRNRYLSNTKDIGVDHNFEDSDEPIKWEHFNVTLPSKFVTNDVGSALSKSLSTKEVFKRGLDELTSDSIETVLDLIAQNSLYRGEEHKSILVKFKKLQSNYDGTDNYAWEHYSKQGSRIRNSVIGSLLIDLSKGIDLEDAVKMFESKVAPQNYKRPTALITPKMIELAEAKVVELGISSSLQRRHSTIDDITVNNILFADRTAKKAMGVFDELKKSAQTGKIGKVEEVPVQKFLEDILPNAESIELMFENKHTGNMVTLVSPEDSDSKPILQWNNNFSWSYAGEVTDSMRERVKSAGGKVDGVLRFSIQWNDELKDGSIDFDAHCYEPNGNHIYYPSRAQTHLSSARLDVDITAPGDNVAIENIVWSDINRMVEGKYRFIVKNYSSLKSTNGFSAEIEYDGVINTFIYDKSLRGEEYIEVAILDFSKQNGVKFKRQLESTVATKETWGINTQQFHKVNIIMNSPNHWDGEEVGNKHIFFMLEGCVNPDDTRGLYNEFLSNNLTEHRKVFEVLGSKLKVKQSDNQLSGIGFSTTKRDSVICKITGSFNRTIKILF